MLVNSPLWKLRNNINGTITVKQDVAPQRHVPMQRIRGRAVPLCGPRFLQL